MFCFFLSLFNFSSVDYVPLGQGGKIGKLERHQESVDSSLDLWQTETTNIRHWQQVTVTRCEWEEEKESFGITQTFNHLFFIFL